ncbi:MAG TPA: glycosyltransferase family 39 protein [Tepidisphaeraceae bacterium]|jgi:hypothetical protein
MTEASVYRSPTLGVILATLGVVLFAAVLRCGMYITLYDDDTELFVYMGKLATQGGRIGYELIDNKLPTVSMAMWLPYTLIGPWWPGYFLFSLALAVISVVAVVAAATRVYPDSKWPTLAAAATWMSFPIAVFSAFKLEHIQLAAAAVAAWAFVRCWQRQTLRDAFLIGLCAGFGAYAKPNALSVLAAAGASVVYWRHVSLNIRVRILTAMAAGLLVPSVIAIVYLVRTGTLSTLPDTYAEIRSYNVNSVFDSNIVFWKILFLIILIATPILMRAFAERHGRQPAVAGQRELMLFAGLWLALETAGAVMQGRMYGYHFLPLTAPAALLFGLIPRRPVGRTIVGSCLPVMLMGGFWFWAATSTTVPPYTRIDAINYVKAHAAPNDRLWIDQYGRALVDSDLKPGSAVPLTFIFSNNDTAPTRFGAMICSDLRQRKTRWVILPSDCVAHANKWRALRSEFCYRPVRGDAYVRAWTKLENYVRSAYVPVNVNSDYTVYERREAVASVGE